MEILRPRPRIDARELGRLIDLGEIPPAHADAVADHLEWHRAATQVLGHERSVEVVERIEAIEPVSTPARRESERSLERAISEALATSRWPALLVLVHGHHAPRAIEPFRTMGPVLGEDVPLFVTDGFEPRRWEAETAPVFDLLGLTADQRRRALTQQWDDGRVEVLFVERGRVLGSALTTVAPRRAGAGPLPMNTKVAIIDLLAAARDVGMPGFAELVPLAREALGMPAGRLARMQRPPMRTRAAAAPPREQPQTSVLRQGASIPTIARPPRDVPPPPKPARPEEKHALEHGRCVRCGKAGAALEGPCGRPELGRVGVLELD